MSRLCLFCGSEIALSVVPVTIECLDCNQINYFKTLVSPKDLGQGGKYRTKANPSYPWQSNNAPGQHRGLIDMDPPDNYIAETALSWPSVEESTVRRNLGLPYDMAVVVGLRQDDLKVYEDRIYGGGATFRVEGSEEETT